MTTQALGFHQSRVRLCAIGLDRMKFTAASATPAFDIYNATGATGADFVLCYAQREPGTADPSSYIPTTTTSVARSGDVVTLASGAAALTITAVEDRAGCMALLEPVPRIIVPAGEPRTLFTQPTTTMSEQAGTAPPAWSPPNRTPVKAMSVRCA